MVSSEYSFCLSKRCILGYCGISSGPSLFAKLLTIYKSQRKHNKLIANFQAFLKSIKIHFVQGDSMIIESNSPADKTVDEKCPLVPIKFIFNHDYNTLSLRAYKIRNVTSGRGCLHCGKIRIFSQS